ncbi:VC0807 family protein [Saccharopolyspora rosea]|uniref:VC0807 family protein n=1 Tax=Saccharopolyspora rosea TaxID=524884 RepID=A0ABW3FZS9_9PSEU|nr:VC0807 family protein [Saccharopolyspora rosea]
MVPSDVDVRGGAARSPLVRTLLINAAAPFAAYEVLTSAGMSELPALAAGAVFPLAAIVVGVVRARRVDWIGAVSLLAIVLSLVGAVVLDSPRLLLLHGSLVTASVGLAFLASLAAPRPVAFVMSRQRFATEDARAAHDRRWAIPAVRRAFRVATGVWGGGLLAEAALRVALSYVVGPGALMLLSPVLAVAVFGALVLWSRGMRARVRALAPVHA